MYAFKQAWQLLLHIPIAITWMLMGLLITIGFGPSAFNTFVTHWNNMVNEIGEGYEPDPHIPTLPDERGYKTEVK